eukprot:3295-Eustigmatos_ZCMA.PRE.1
MDEQWDGAQHVLPHEQREQVRARHAADHESREHHSQKRTYAWIARLCQTRVKKKEYQQYYYP